jgi:hypothetical protein
MKLRKDFASERCNIIIAIHISKYRTVIIKRLHNVNESTFKLAQWNPEKHYSQLERMYNSPYIFHGEKSG